MTLNELVEAIKAHPEAERLMNMQLGDAPHDGRELPLETQSQVYVDKTREGTDVLCVSGGGYPFSRPIQRVV